MDSTKCRNVMTSVAAALSIGCAAAWLAGWLTDAGPWPVRAFLLSAAVVLAGSATALLVHHAGRSRRATERYFNALCEANPDSLGGLGAGTALPSPPAGAVWAEAANQLQERLAEFGRQIQELKHAQTVWDVRYRRAKAERDRVMAIFSNLAEPILAIDDYDELVLANRSAEEMFHFNSEKTESRALRQIVHCQKLIDLLTTTCHRKTPAKRSDELEVEDDEGHRRWYRVTALKLTGGQGRSGESAEAEDGATSQGAVAVLRDIGDQKALQKRNAEFVSAVSHEMKTPLAGIKAYVELLVDGDAEDEQTQEEFLDVINSQADRLQRLVDNMLNLARIEAGVVQVSKETRALNELLEEALNVVQPAAEAKQIELVADLSPMYLGVLADRDMLLQAAINLLSNAIKYTPAEGQVTLRSRLEGNEVRFEVQDTGVGLSEEDCRRVFEKFYRVNKNKEMAPGTGLGLPLAKHIVEDVHGGRLAATSTLGEGSVFAVTLPNAGQLT
ncbi:MAG: PAS domain-containing protein [Pirellulales bacterium]|nr:PAS domain-containing protein [Pirellulales bacterium]